MGAYDSSGRPYILNVGSGALNFLLDVREWSGSFTHPDKVSAIFGVSVLAKARAELAALRAENAQLQEEKRDIIRQLVSENARSQARIDGFNEERQRWRSRLGLMNTDQVVQENNRLDAEIARLRKALDEAGQSLHTISLAGGRESHLSDMVDVRGFANSRANEVYNALSASKDAERDAGCPVAPRGAWLSLEQLREIEWGAEGCDVRGGEVTAYAACPACGGAHPLFEPNQPSQLGHAPDCWLAQAIKMAEEGQ